MTLALFKILRCRKYVLSHELKKTWGAYTKEICLPTLCDCEFCLFVVLFKSFSSQIPSLSSVLEPEVVTKLSIYI